MAHRPRSSASADAPRRVGGFTHAARRLLVDVPSTHFFLCAVVLWFAVLGFVLYGRVLNAPFTFDDALWTTARTTQAVTLSQVGAVLDSPVPRKLARASFALNFYFGRLNPLGYHLFNVVLHVLNGVLLFLLGRELLRLLPEDHTCRRHADVVALLGATIWVAHPIQTQAVTYVWQRATSLCAFWYLACVLAYVKARTTSSGWRSTLYAVAVMTGVTAMSAKENAGSLPGALALVEVAMVRSAGARREKAVPIRLLASTAAGLIAIAAHYLGPRFVMMIAADFERRGFSLAERLLSEARICSYYLSLLVVPSPGRLTLDYDFTVSRGFFDPLTTAPSVFLIVVLIGGAIALLRRAPLVAFPILWFFGLLVIESTVVPLDLAYEHRLYLPSTIPIVFAIAALLSWRDTLRSLPRRSLACAVVVAVFGMWTWQRNELWRNPTQLWADTVRKSPNKARVHVNLAKALLESGDYTGALRSYERAHDLDPRLVEPLSAMGKIYMEHFDDAETARRILHEAVERSPSYVPALVNLGVVQMRTGEMDAAARSFVRALDVDAHEPAALYNLAALSFNKRDYVDAEQRLVKGSAAWPAHARMRALLALVYLESGDRARCESVLEAAAALAPKDAMVNAVQRELTRRSW